MIEYADILLGTPEWMVPLWIRNQRLSNNIKMDFKPLDMESSMLNGCSWRLL